MNAPVIAVDPDGRVSLSRPGVGRAKTISVERLSQRERELARREYPDTDHDRPQTRGECLHGPMAVRPCPFVGCKYHLFLDVNERTGSIKLNFPELEVWELTETCALDVADRGGLTLAEVGELISLGRERIRQVEERTLRALRVIAESRGLGELLDETAPSPKGTTPVTGATAEPWEHWR